ncbi:MAG: DEAD/DEAH box helicase [Pirellulaceae bacterium]
MISGTTSAPTTEITFADLNLDPAILAAVESSGYTHPTPIQAETIPPLLLGRDVLGQAQTGTGKTAAFALPMLQRIDLTLRKPQLLVLAPTRELAIQVAESFETYSAQLKGLTVATIYGGQDYAPQLRQIERGAQVVVGTPGRVMDHMRRGSLNLDNLQGLVLDEADEMLRMGFADDVQWVLTQSPDQRQIALFSATMSPTIRKIAQQHLTDPVEITIEQKTATADTIRQRYVVAAPHLKEKTLCRLLEGEPIEGVIIFVRTKSTTEPLADTLNRAGHRAAALSGDIQQKQRERIVDNLRSGKLNIIVATDVAARGLDVPCISHVINYDLPIDSEAYVHRIGRTGRAGRSGEAILFVHPRERGRLKRLEFATRQAIEPMELPNNRAINKQRVAKFHEQIAEGAKHQDRETFASVLEQYRRETDVSWEEIAISLAALANGGTPLLLKDEMRQSSFAESHGNDRPQHDSGPRRTSHAKRNEPRSREKGMETFRVEVGHAHQVGPGNLVAAIAKEAGVESAKIGRIEIFNDFSTIDLPEGLSTSRIVALGKVRVSGRALNASKLDGPITTPRRFESKRSGGKPAFKSKPRRSRA